MRSNINAIYLSQIQRKDTGIRAERHEVEQLPALLESVEAVFSRLFASALDRPDCFEPSRTWQVPDWERQLDRVDRLHFELAHTMFIGAEVDCVSPGLQAPGTL